MFGSFDELTVLGLVSLGIFAMFGVIWILSNFLGNATPLQKMFCPDDRSTCHCRSCLAERGEL